MGLGRKSFVERHQGPLFVFLAWQWVRSGFMSILHAITLFYALFVISIVVVTVRFLILLLFGVNCLYLNSESLPLTPFRGAVGRGERLHAM